MVFDAPGSDSGTGETTVTAAAGPDGRCQVTLSTSGGKTIAGRPAIFALGPAAAGCIISEDAAAGQVIVAGPPVLEPRGKRTGGCSYVIDRFDQMDPAKKRRKAIQALVFGGGAAAVVVAGALLRRRRRKR